MQQGYYSAAWSDIKNSPGWFSKICLMGLLSAIPVFGSMVVYGYSYGWARDIAWNVHRPMPDRLLGNEDGKLYSRGIFAYLIFFVASFVAVVPTAILGDSSLGALVVLVLAIFLSVFACIGVIRMAIYGRLSAGFQLNKMWAMMSHDFNGFLRIVGMSVLIALIVSIAAVVAFCVPLIVIVVSGVISLGADLGSLLYSSPSSVDASAVGAVVPGFVISLVLILIVAYAMSCVSSWFCLLQARAIGYWTRQFEVASWRGQDDPMPFEVAKAATVAAAVTANAPVSAQPVASEAPAVSDAAEEAAVAAPVADAPEDPVAPDAESQTTEEVAPVADEDAPAVQADPEQASQCPSCGAKVGSSARFCVFCGAKIRD